MKTADDCIKDKDWKTLSKLMVLDMKQVKENKKLKDTKDIESYNRIRLAQIKHRRG